MNNKSKKIRFFSKWLKSSQRYKHEWTEIEQVLKQENESYGFIPKTNDIWVRDFMPFVKPDYEFVMYRFSPDYLKGRYEKYITNGETAFKSLYGNIRDISNFINKTNLIIDGGNLIGCKDKNGRYCMIMTDKVLRENSNWPKDEIIYELQRVFNAEIILIPWDTAEKYGHADGMVRSIGEGKLLLNCYCDIDTQFNNDIIRILTPHFDISQLNFGKYYNENSWCHLNYMELTDSILVPVAGIQSDDVSLCQIEKFTHKRCIPVHIPKIVEDGGALHCVSWTVDAEHSHLIDWLIAQESYLTEA